MDKNTWSNPTNCKKFDTAEDVQVLIDDIKTKFQDEKLLTIDLSGNTFGIEASQALAAVLAEKDEIEVVNMSDCFTGRMLEEIPPALIAFGDALADKKNLKELNLSDNAFGPNGAKPLKKLLSTNNYIQILKLNNNGLGVEGGNCIASYLLAAQEKNVKENKKSSLHTLIAGRNRLENGSMEKLSEALAAHGTIKTLRIPQNGIRSEGISLLLNNLKACKDLEVLDLQDNTFKKVTENDEEIVEADGSSALADALPSWPKLKVLNVGDCLLGKNGGKIVAALGTGFNDLEEINFTYGELVEKDALEFSKHISKLPNIKKIELDGNAFSATGKAVEAIKQALEDCDLDEDVLGELEDMDYDSDEEDEEDEDNEQESDDDVNNIVENINNLKL
ncbi:RNI-like protein [Anaeromyces robustus]|uniref:RNI-like protein n=1 Tax=Anaeromyces robustus TaxID=1754192 RepID=A0A1Y1X8C5_9FUNG|nr:RNI-like protein [Anaeromyces robustus]|eukprot:ORX81982.1 RNI-like protein [Anaeromyces robustus]